MNADAQILAGRVAVVTGAGRGIGRAIAQALAAAGAAVVVAARTADEIQKTAALITEQGGRATAVTVDVGDRASVDGLVAQTLDAYGRVDILVNNAGIQGPIGPLVDNDPADWERTLRVNLFGTFLCSQAVLPHMIAQKSGKIINLSGGGATAPRPNFSAYGASKVAIVRLTETLAVEVEDHNIQVNAIAPGAVNTRMLDEVLEAADRAGSEADAARQRAEQGGTPPTLAAELAVFLSSPAADGLTGRLVAAPHDGWQGWDAERMTELMQAPWLTLRRMDPYTLKPLVAAISE